MNKIVSRRVLTVLFAASACMIGTAAAAQEVQAKAAPVKQEVQTKAVPIKQEAQTKENSVKQVNFQTMTNQENLPPAIANQKPVEAQTLDIDLTRTVETAVRNNRDINISEWTLKEAQSAVGEAAAGKNPSVSYGFSAERYKAKNTNGYSVSSGGTVTPVTVSTNHTYGNSLDVTWPLYTGGKVEGEIEAARYSARVSEQSLYETEAAIKLSAISGYYQLLEDMNLQDVDQESVNNLSEHLTNVQQQYQAGIVARLDVLTSTVSLANAKQIYIESANTRNLAEANLNNIMRTPVSTKLIPVDKTMPQPPFTITQEQAEAMAMQYRWELKEADYNVEIAKQQLREAHSGHMPTVALTGGYTWNNEDFPGFKNQNWTVTGSVSLPIFDGGVTNAKIQEAKDVLKIAEETAAKEHESIQLEVKQDYLNVVSAKERIATTTAAVEQAEEAYKIAVVRYKAGVGINLDVLDAQLSLNSAKTNYITALYDYNIGLATLDKAMGVPAVIRR